MSAKVMKSKSIISSNSRVTFPSPWLLLVLYICIFVTPSCHRFAQLLFVAVRESDFRIGPFELPLNEDSKKAITNFLARSGDNAISDIVEPAALESYSELLDLLSTDSFVEKANNLRSKRSSDTAKIADSLKEWLRNPIVFQVVDATQKRPEIINPFAISDGQFWWIFYREGDEISGYKLARLLVTVDIRRILKH